MRDLPTDRLHGSQRSDDGRAQPGRGRRRQLPATAAPAVPDAELDALAAANPAVQVLRMPLTHLAPAWDAIDEVVVEIERFLSAAPR